MSAEPLVILPSLGVFGEYLVDMLDLLEALLDRAGPPGLASGWYSRTNRQWALRISSWEAPLVNPSNSQRSFAVCISKPTRRRDFTGWSIYPPAGFRTPRTPSRRPSS